jgi:microcystin-dependent protein
MSQPYLGEVRFVGFDYAPNGWAPCDGRLMDIRDYSALYSLLGTTYGGDGMRNFALPNLNGRTAISEGRAVTQTPFPIGQAGGTEQVTLNSATIPGHGHMATIAFTKAPSLQASVAVVDGEASQSSPVGNVPAQSVIRGRTTTAVNSYAPTTAITAGAKLAGVNVNSAASPTSVITLSSTGSPTPTPINKRPPVVVGQYIIALTGLYPEQP